jgi:hypothetical protein
MGEGAGVDLSHNEVFLVGCFHGNGEEFVID